MSGQKKLKKPQSKALRKAKKSNKQINKELPIIAAINQKWKAALQKAKLLNELLQANEAGKCLVVETETGVYHSKKIQIITEDHYNQISYEESIPIKKVKKKKEWIQKKTKKDCPPNAYASVYSKLKKVILLRIINTQYIIIKTALLGFLIPF